MGEPLVELFSKKKFTVPKKLKGVPFGFSNIHFVAKFREKMKVGPFSGKKIGENCRTVPRKPEGGTKGGIGIVCYAKKNKNLFGSAHWSNSYNLAPSFKFCRTCVVAIIKEQPLC